MRRALLLLVLAACSEGSDPPPAQGRWVVATTLFNPDSTTSLVGLVEDPGAPGATLDLATAIELGGAVALFSDGSSSVFAVGSSDAPTITRYQVEDGVFVAGPSMSFAPAGLSSGFLRAGLVPFVSPEKAYWLDSGSQQAIIWNPRTMELTGSISLAGAAREPYLLELGDRAIVRGGLVFVPAAYRAADELEAGEAVVLVIDGSTDSLVDVLHDDRCGDTGHVIEGSDGTLYFASGPLAAIQWRLQRPAGYPAPCVLRILPGERVFDPSWSQALDSRLGGRAGGRLVAGVGEHVYVRVLDESLLAAPLGPDTPLFDPWDAPAWRWYRFSLADDAPAVAVDGVAPASASGLVLRAGGQELVTQGNLETGQTTLLVPQADGGLAAGLVVAGYSFGLVKLP